MTEQKTQQENPEQNPLLELNLNMMTILESVKYEEDFSRYSTLVGNLLMHREMLFTQKEILEEFQMTDIEELLARFPHVLCKGNTVNDQGEISGKLFADLGMRYFVQPTDSHYDEMFAYKLRQLDFMHIDRFLDYHLLNYYHCDLADFSRFLTLCMRKYEKSLLDEKKILSVKEWMEYRERQQKQQLQKSIQEEAENASVQNQKEKEAKKIKMKRQAGDKRTSLSQEQTVLLMYFLQQEKVILKDEYLNDMEAGQAFEILTGYSQHTLRQNLGKFYLFQNNENLKTLDNVLTRIKIKIDQALKEK